MTTADVVTLVRTKPVMCACRTWQVDVVSETLPAAEAQHLVWEELRWHARWDCPMWSPKVPA